MSESLNKGLNTGHNIEFKVIIIYMKYSESALQIKLRRYFPQHIMKRQIHSIAQSFRFHVDQFSKHLTALSQIYNS